MTEMLSPGVYTEEYDNSQIAPTVSTSICAFSGNFKIGPVGSYTLNTSVDDLIANHGYPDNENYNDWFQAYNFLQYGNKLLIARAANTNGTTEAYDDTTFISIDDGNDRLIHVSDAKDVSVNDMIQFDIEGDETVYVVTAVNLETEIDENGVEQEIASINIDRTINADFVPEVGTAILHFIQCKNGIIEIGDERSTQDVTFDEDEGQTGDERVYTIYGDPVDNPTGYFYTNMLIGNATDFEMNEQSIQFASPSKSKLKFISRNPGGWASKVEICVAPPSAFLANDPDYLNHETKYAFQGVAIDDLFEYAPKSTQFGVVIRYDGVIKEVFTVDTLTTGKDSNNRSTYVENVINNQSNYVFVKDNTSNDNMPGDTTLFLDVVTNTYVGYAPTLLYGFDSDIQQDDLLDGYELFSNKEELDLDIVIANELDGSASAKSLVETRQDCISFIGAKYEDVVGKKATDATTNLVTWRLGGSINYDSMFSAAFGNYKYQYDRYNDVNRWVNIAGDIAGLRAQTSTTRATWWASAGLERGQIKNVVKLAFNPTQPMRDMLYKNGINPCVTFPGQGPVCWGQKTLLSEASSFDRINVRGLFNTLERSLGKMAKYEVMEFNDTFTRNKIISMINPYLASVQAGRGIDSYLVICDESNNTADVISRNQLVVDIYIKPTYVAEFILLRFTNAGTNSFASIVGA